MDPTLGINSASSRQASAVVSSSWLRVIQKSGREAAVVAHLRLHLGAGGQGVDVGLAQRDVIGAGNGQAKHGPEMCDVLKRQPD